VIVYLRTLASVRNPLPQTEIIFPVKYLIRGAPEPVTASVPQPDLSDPVKRGAFLVRMSGLPQLDYGGLMYSRESEGKPPFPTASRMPSLFRE
jgi:hypothetical protein